MDENENVVGDQTLESESAGAGDEQELSAQDDKTEEKDGGVEKRLKDTQSKLTEVSQARAELQRQFDELRGQVNVLAASKEAKKEEYPDPFAFLDEKEFRESFFEDSEKPISAIKETIRIFGNALVAQKKDFDNEISRLRGEMNRPSGELAERIAELKKDPDYAELGDKALTVIAKKMAGEKKAGKEYPGGSSPNSRVPAGGSGNSELERRVGSIMKKYYATGE